MSEHKHKRRLSNKFVLSEWSGALGDLGTTLPLAFALAVYNGFPVSRLFFMWGLVYVVTGSYFKVPVSVQPLKAMAVIAIASGVSQELLSNAAFFYGILFLFLTLSGVIERLHRLFSRALIRGIQLGVGLILAQKAVELALKGSLHLGGRQVETWYAAALTTSVIFVLYFGRKLLKRPVVIFVLAVGVVTSWLAGIRPGMDSSISDAARLTLPNLLFLPDALLLLIVPQLPLTLGNAVFAAKDACHEFWHERAERVSVTKLAGSIGLSNVLIGLAGGFPVCHGSGGVAAHARFGAKTGGATVILGLLLIALASIDNWSGLLFLVPIPILGALLLFDSLTMIALVKRLASIEEWIVALSVGIIAFTAHNLTLAMAAGLGFQWILRLGFIREKAERLNRQYFNDNKLSEFIS